MSLRIQFNSTKLLSFYVNDILDFAKLSGGKFRKECRNLNLKESIEEILLIMKDKAES